jgi:hypothetical protein
MVCQERRPKSLLKSFLKAIHWIALGFSVIPRLHSQSRTSIKLAKWYILPMSASEFIIEVEEKMP